jgi:hypothetical protein
LVKTDPRVVSSYSFLASFSSSSELNIPVTNKPKILPRRFVVGIAPRTVLRAKSEMSLASSRVVAAASIGMDTLLRLTVFTLLLIDLDMVFPFVMGPIRDIGGGIPQGYIAECYILNPRKKLKTL